MFANFTSYAINCDSRTNQSKLDIHRLKNAKRDFVPYIIIPNSVGQLRWQEKNEAAKSQKNCSGQDEIEHVKLAHSSQPHSHQNVAVAPPIVVNF